MARSKQNVEQVAETPVAAELVEVPVEVPKIAFEVWFAMRAKRIPPQHMQEIIWSDFRGRGLSANETVEAFDAALAAYGIK